MSDQYDAILQMIGGFPDRDDSLEQKQAIENAVQLAQAVNADDFFPLLAQQLEAALDAPVQIEQFAWAIYTQAIMNRSWMQRVAALSGEAFDEIATSFRNGLLPDTWFLGSGEQEGGPS